MLKLKTIGFLLNRTQHYTPVLSEKVLVSYFQKKNGFIQVQVVVHLILQEFSVIPLVQ